MRKEEFCEILGDINENHVKEAKTPNKSKKPVWLKWGAMAACLCLVVAGLTIPSIFNQRPGGGTPDAGGNHLDGIGPVIKTIAVYPANEDIQNVEDATVESIDEETAYGMSVLGNYLPTQLPDDYQFGKASIYETTMKNGTTYNMLRVIYTNGSPTTEQTGEGELAHDANTFGDEFVVFVMNYKPNTEKRIYTVADITEDILAEMGGQVFHIAYRDIYVGISGMDLQANDIMTVINSIGPDIEPTE